MLVHEILPTQGRRPREPAGREEPDSYEVTIPMSADSELVAVRAFEQIVEGIDFSEKAKGQVRMALMEACINIREGFAGDSGKIHLGFKTAEVTSCGGASTPQGVAARKLISSRLGV